MTKAWVWGRESCSIVDFAQEQGLVSTVREIGCRKGGGLGGTDGLQPRS